MNSEVRARVLQLLKSSQNRKQKIKLLRYELLHHANISDDEMIIDMTFGKGKDVPGSSEHFSDKTFYIALNYQELADKINTEVARETAAELAKLEDELDRLIYYVSLLDNREAQVIRRVYFGSCSWDQVAKELGVVRRTAHKIKERALANLTWMYEYMDGIEGDSTLTVL